MSPYHLFPQIPQPTGLNFALVLALLPVSYLLLPSLRRPPTRAPFFASLCILHTQCRRDSARTVLDVNCHTKGQFHQRWLN